MSVTTQIIFPYMSDARTPAMDVQMTAQDVCMTRSFHVFLSAMLIEDNGYFDSQGSVRDTVTLTPHLYHATLYISILSVSLAHAQHTHASLRLVLV